MVVVDHSHYFCSLHDYKVGKRPIEPSGAAQSKSPTLWNDWDSSDGQEQNWSEVMYFIVPKREVIGQIVCLFLACALLWQ